MRISFAEGLAKAIYESLAADPRVVLIGSGFMGLNMAARQTLEPALREFSDRILVTPISELALAGAGIGAAANCDSLRVTGVNAGLSGARMPANERG